jgi:hypothetical protein
LRCALVALLTAVVAAVAAGAASARTNPFAVPAVRQSLSRAPTSPVAHDTETMALVAHSGRLFAATDQWQYASPTASGQVLVKNSARAPWQVFERTESVRVQALDSFPIPADQGLGHGHSLLITQAIVGGRSRIQWLLDRARSFKSFSLASIGTDVRAFGAHDAGGKWAVYAGANPTGILRGVWSRKRRTLVFNPKPELSVAPPASRGLKTQKVTGFANCAGALYASINTKLFRRNDGRLASGMSRWTLVYQEPPVGIFNSGLRGLTCISRDGAPSLLVSTEGTGDVYRLGHLPRGQVAAEPRSGQLPGGLTATMEFSPAKAIAEMLASEGTAVPASGTGAIDYVIAAYNNFAKITIGGVERQLFGVEWNYAGACPASRTCTPSHYDAAACFAVRTDRGASPSYALRCLSGRQFRPSGTSGPPVRAGQAFVSIRTIEPSPFDRGHLYFGGYDCNFYPADGTAWIASSTLAALHLR